MGQYENYRSGGHAALVVNKNIDLRMFPKNWVTAFAVEKETDQRPRRSLQIFDAAGDAIHKIHLREASNQDLWTDIVDGLKLDDQSDALDVVDRTPTEGPKGDPAKAEKLREEWDKLTDTDQFLQMTRKLKMNRLGAYRMAGAPYVRQLQTTAVETLLNKASEGAVPIMIFVGNQGCIEIHTGPVEKIVKMGPWINVLDPGHDLHLRTDHIAEVWAVTKNTRRGPAVSVEAFDAEGWVIAQFFGVLAEEGAASRWNTLVDTLETLEEVEPA